MRKFLLLMACLMLAACSRGPDASTLQADLKARLQQVFGSQLQLRDVQRRGSATDSQAPADTERLIVYFDAELELEQAYDFSAWDSPGAASLLSLLGAGPRGITGILSGGNQAGDRLRAHGSLIYQRQGDGWQALVAQGFSQPQQPRNEQSDDSQLISAITTALNLSPGGTSEQTRKIIQEEVLVALGNIKGRLSRLENGYALASGPAYGQYSRFADAFSRLLQPHKIKLSSLLTDGGLDNLQLLRAGKVQLALSQSDTAYQALHGIGPFARDGADTQLRALASLYPEPVHVLVRSDGPQRIAELRGKRVNLGLPGSASRDTALAVLAAHGLQPSDLASSSELDLQSALSALRDGQLDALLQVIGIPADTIRSASDALDLRLLALEQQAIATLQKSRPGTFAFTLPAGSYPRQQEAVATLAVSSLLLTEQPLTNHEAQQLLSLLFTPGTQWLSLGSVQGSQLSAKQSLTAIGIPLHPGALEVLKNTPSALP